MARNDRMPRYRPAHVSVVVLGDLGRSPRMLRHAECLLRRGLRVDLVGFDQTQLPESLADARRVAVPAREGVRRRGGGAAAVAAVRQGLLALGLFGALLRSLPRGGTVLVQVPPLVALGVARLAARLRGGRVVGDWHNVSAPLVAERFGRGLAERAVAAGERRLARSTAHRFAVSRALADRLDGDAAVLRDLPVTTAAPAAVPPLGFEPSPGLCRDAVPVPRPGVAHTLVVAPSSFRPDDDFELLIAALRRIDTRLAGRPPLVVALTGKGERRPAVEAALAGLELQRVSVATGWLAAPQYHSLLASADAGLSLHRSASGLDLPIKLVEMAGAGTPLLVLDYGEVLRETVGGEASFFRTAAELAELLVAVVDAPRSLPPPPRLPSWETEWHRIAWPLLDPSAALAD